jgi:hypothetical protein
VIGVIAAMQAAMPAEPQRRPQTSIEQRTKQDLAVEQRRYDLQITQSQFVQICAPGGSVSDEGPITPGVAEAHWNAVQRIVNAMKDDVNSMLHRLMARQANVQLTVSPIEPKVLRPTVQIAELVGSQRCSPGLVQTRYPAREWWNKRD